MLKAEFIIQPDKLTNIAVEEKLLNLVVLPHETYPIVSVVKGEDVDVMLLIGALAKRKHDCLVAAEWLTKGAA